MAYLRSHACCVRLTLLYGTQNELFYTNFNCLEIRTHKLFVKKRMINRPPYLLQLKKYGFTRDLCRLLIGIAKGGKYSRVVPW
jgi:hypothetical protein